MQFPGMYAGSRLREMQFPGMYADYEDYVRCNFQECMQAIKITKLWNTNSSSEWRSGR
jgi:hypothetical protein